MAISPYDQETRQRAVRLYFEEGGVPRVVDTALVSVRQRGLR